jgi:hypothetical protein
VYVNVYIPDAPLYLYLHAGRFYALKVVTGKEEQVPDIVQNIGSMNLGMGRGAVCGDGILNGNEECDWSTIVGQTEIASGTCSCTCFSQLFIYLFIRLIHA